MLKISLTAVMLVALVVPADAAKCFIFCPPVRHHATRPHNAKFCDTVNVAYAIKPGSRDEFVRSFPPRKQRRVLLCLEEVE